MKAIDTNLVIRLLLDDDPVQSAAVKALLGSGGVVISPAVLLETLWVLESRFGASDDVLLDTVAAIARFSSVAIGRPERVAEFFRVWRGGLDSEDAAHLAFADDVDAFVTFDRASVRRAKKLGSTVTMDMPPSRR
jgi:predicted nucleic-acid-binding protein